MLLVPEYPETWQDSECTGSILETKEIRKLQNVILCFRIVDAFSICIGLPFLLTASKRISWILVTCVY